MAETETATSTPSEPNGSEFARPVGKDDDATFQKFFGKDSKHFDDGGKTKEAKKASTRDSTWNEKDEKAAAKAKESEKKPEKKAPKPEASSKSGSTSKDPDSKPDTKAAEAGSKPEKRKEEPSSKDDADSLDAKTLLKQAKEEPDRRKARALYRKAMETGLGEVPEEFSPARWEAGRRMREKETEKIEKRRREVDGQLNQGVQKLTPAINVMKRLQAAGFVHIDKASGTVTNNLDSGRVDQAIEVMKALRELEDGDFTTLGRIVEKATGKSSEEAMKLFVRGVKASPEGRAARAAAEQAQARTQALEQQLAQLKQSLEQERTQNLTKAQQAEQRQQAERKRADYLEHINTELEGHEVLLLPNGSKRVLQLLMKTRHPTLKSPTLTFDQAADRIVNYERRRLAESRSALEPEAPAGRERVRTVPRTESADTGVSDPSPEASFARIWGKHQAGGRR